MSQAEWSATAAGASTLPDKSRAASGRPRSTRGREKRACRSQSRQRSRLEAGSPTRSAIVKSSKVEMFFNNPDNLRLGETALSQSSAPSGLSRLYIMVRDFVGAGQPQQSYGSDNCPHFLRLPFLSGARVEMRQELQRRLLGRRFRVLTETDICLLSKFELTISCQMALPAYIDYYSCMNAKRMPMLLEDQGYRS